MHLEILVEERSAEVALGELLPKVAPHCSFRIHPHGGKPQLLARLPARLRGYRGLLQARTDWRVVVLVDEDREDCKKLKKQIIGFARHARIEGAVLARIAVEEIEAWFLGDNAALVSAYPRVPRSLSNRRGFRDPDAVAGGTWEALERVLQQAGYHRSGLPKNQAARAIASKMDVERNLSHSFRVFRDGIRVLSRGTD